MSILRLASRLLLLSPTDAAGAAASCSHSGTGVATHSVTGSWAHGPRTDKGGASVREEGGKKGDEATDASPAADPNLLPPGGCGPAAVPPSLEAPLRGVPQGWRSRIRDGGPPAPPPFASSLSPSGGAGLLRYGDRPWRSEVTTRLAARGVKLPPLRRAGSRREPAQLPPPSGKARGQPLR